MIMIVKRLQNLFQLPYLGWILCSSAFILVPSTTSGTGGRRARELWLASAQDENDNPLSDTSRLSHVMLKVPSVDTAIDYWTKKGGIVLQSTKLTMKVDMEWDQELYCSAFVTLGNGKTTENCFALELVRTNDKNGSYQMGNAIDYLGVSLLLQFQGNFRGLLAGEIKASPAAEYEPNGISVRSCAASPGDYFCRFCLRSGALEATQAFYEDVLGMELAAGDHTQICLRYSHRSKDNSCDGDSFGVPTTLVFTQTDEPVHVGTCFDHLAIRTSASIPELFSQLQEKKGAKIFLKPTQMFGSTVLGLVDPNGYKVVLAGPPLSP